MVSVHPLLVAIADLESRRAVLGDAAVDAAVAVLQAQLAKPVSAGGVLPAEPALGAAPSASDGTTKPVDATASPEAPSAARLRQVSVLFVDVADSTALLQHASPEDAHQLIGVALERFAAVVQAAGGQVLRFMGDGLKAAFGAQGVHEDEAERAVSAGLAILAAAAEHAHTLQTNAQARPPSQPVGTDPQRPKQRFGVRVGIHSGPVLLGAGPEADRTAMGLAVHLAARMEQSAPVGCLRISHDTALLVQGLFQMQAQPPLMVKGHDQPLKTWLVLGAAGGPERAVQRGVEGVATPMVGREAEMQALRALWQRCCSQRSSALALVLADAGVGKTRLRHELQRALEFDTPPAQRALTLQARAHPADRLQPYGLLRQLLTRWLGIGDELSAENARLRFVEGLQPWLLGAEDGSSQLAPVQGRAALHRNSAAQTRAQRLAHLLGLDFSASAQVQALGARELRQQALATLAEVLHRRAQQQPLLLVLDDVHWADDASLDALQHLAQPPQGAAPAAWMLLLLARPALLERCVLPGHAPAGEAAQTPRLQLQPALQLHLLALTPDQGSALARALLAQAPDAPATVHRLLVARAQGNPYFMEELLRRLIDDGVINTSTSPWQVDAHRLQGLQLPQSLVGLLQARLDALPADELAALQQASIVGPVFWTSALQAVDAAAPAALPALQRHDTVTQQPHSVFADDTEHAFVHPLLHEVTYGTVLKPARRAGHAHTARWLAARTGGRAGEHLALTADHFERAGDHAMALDCYDRAQRDALDRFAHSAALALLDRALNLLATTQHPLPPRHRFHLYTQRQTALDHLGRVAESKAQLQVMAAFAETVNDDSMRADVAVLRMLQADHEGQPDDARALAEEALACCARDGSATAMAAASLAHGELAWLALQSHDFTGVQQHIDAGVACARRCAQVPPREGGYAGYEVQLRTIEIDARMRQAHFVVSDDAVGRALQSLVDVRHSFLLDRFHLLGLRCTIRRQLGDLETAQQLADECQALAAQLEMPRIEAAALINVAEVALFTGQPAVALQAADEVEKVAQERDYPYLLTGVWRWRGEAAWARADWAGADAAWSRAAQLMQQQQRLPEALQLRCQRALLAVRLASAAADAAPATESTHRAVPSPASVLALERAVQDAKAALAESAADPRAHHGALEPTALWACHEVLAAAGDAGAPALRAALLARLQDQLAQLHSAADRARLLQHVPHWRALAAWLPPAGA